MGLIILLTCLIVFVFGILVIAAIILIRSKSARHGITLSEISTKTKNKDDTPAAIVIHDQDGNETQPETNYMDCKQFQMPHRLD